MGLRITNEFGKLKRVAVHKPLKLKADQEHIANDMMREREKLVELLQSRRVEIEEIDMGNHCVPVAIWARDAAFCVGSTIYCNTLSYPREREAALVMQYFRAQYRDNVVQIPRGRVDGGDVLPINEERVLVGINTNPPPHYRDSGTTEEGISAFQALARERGKDAIRCPYQGNFPHLDCAVQLHPPLQGETGAYYDSEACLPETIDRLRDVVQRPPVPFHDPKNRFALNGCWLDTKTIITGSDSALFRAQLLRDHFKESPCALEVSNMRGGSVHCYLMPLIRED